MNTSASAPPETDIKRVGKSGQISLGKELAGQYFREQHLDDGTIVLVPVVVVPKTHWTVRDQEKIRRGLDWAAKHPPRESDLGEVMAMASKPRRRGKRGD